MNERWWILWEAAVNFGEYLLVFALLNSKLERRARSTVPPILCLLVFSAFLTAFNALSVHEVWTMLMTLGLIVAYSQCFFRGPIGMRVMWACASVEVLLCANIATSIIVTAFTADTSRLLIPSYARLFPTSLYLALDAFLTLVLIRIPTRHFTLPRGARFGVIIYSIAICVTGAVLEASVLRAPLSDPLRQVFQIAGLVLAALTIAFFFVIERVGVYYEAEQKSLLELDRKRLQMRNAELLREQQRKWAHDEKHHLLTIRYYAKHRDYDGLLEYLDDLGLLFSAEMTVFDCTGIPQVDAVIEQTANACQKQRIAFSSSVESPCPIPLTPPEISALLGNVLDNAVRAAEKCPPDSNRFVNLEMRHHQSMFLLRCTNGSTGNYTKDTAGNLLSTRRAGHERGLGLRRIMDIAEKADGFVEWTEGLTSFSIDVWLPIAIEKKRAVEE